MSPPVRDLPPFSPRVCNLFAVARNLLQPVRDLPSAPHVLIPAQNHWGAQRAAAVRAAVRRCDSGDHGTSSLPFFFSLPLLLPLSLRVLFISFFPEFPDYTHYTTVST
ncbi:ParB/RepB/Spo0J family partition protein [Sesbania bispinosa]|nr:ParB/RepB/Spo0J family partition protein [Sesbania bispinosa]